MGPPITLHRSTNALISNALLATLGRSADKMTRAEQQILAQRRILKPSDDPTGAAEALLLIAERARTKRAQDNRAQVVQRLNLMEGQLIQFQSALADAKALAIQGSDASTDRKSLAAGVGETIERMVSVMNFFDGRQYVFGGTRTDLQPFAVVDGLVHYRGNEERLRAALDGRSDVEYTLDGAGAVGALQTRLASRFDLDPEATANTALADLNGGRGVRTGRLRIAVSVVGASVPRVIDVDLNGAVTLGDVVNRINGAAQNVVRLPGGATTGTYVKASIAGGRLTLTADEDQFNAQSDNVTLEITSLNDGAAAEDLGFTNSYTAGLITVTGTAASSVDLTVTSTTGVTTSTIALAAGGGSSNVFSQARDLADAINNDATLSGLVAAEAAGDQVIIRVTNGTVRGDALDLSAAAGDLDLTFDTQPSDGMLISADLDPRLTLATDLRDLRLVDPDDPTGAVQRFTSSADFGGLKITNGDNVANVSLAALDPGLNPGQTPTVEKFLDLINRSGTYVEARIADDGRGIELRSRLSGSRLTIQDLGTGTSASKLGLDSDFGRTLLKDLNSGRGVDTEPGADLAIYTHDRNAAGGALGPITIDVPDAFQKDDFDAAGKARLPNLNDLVTLINTNAANQFSNDAAVAAAGGAGLSGVFAFARLDATNQRLVIEDRTQVAQFLGVNAANDGFTVTLAVDTFNADGSVASTVSRTYTASTVAAPGVDGVFSSLAELVEEINGDLVLNPPGSARGAIASADGTNLRLVSETGGLRVSDNTGGAVPALVATPTTAQGATYVAENFRVERLNNAFSAESLGLTANAGTSSVIRGGPLSPAGATTPDAFSAFSHLYEALASDDIAALSVVQKELDQAMRHILARIETLGQRSQSLGGEFALSADFDGSLKRLDERIGRVAGLDPVEAALKLEEFRTLFTLGIQAAARVSRVSLLDFL